MTSQMAVVRAARPAPRQPQTQKDVRRFVDVIDISWALKADFLGGATILKAGEIDWNDLCRVFPL
jgi:hypothetical protein